MEDVVEALVAVGALQGKDIQGLLQDADGALVPLGIGADRARVHFGDVLAL